MRGLFNSILSLFHVFMRGGVKGNVPSPRYLVNIPIPEPYVKTTVQNTNSMEPLLDVGHTVILREPFGRPVVGDIIIWERNHRSIIHSVIETGMDGEWYCRTKGLNLYQPDPEKIRLEEVKWFVVGVLWTHGEGNFKAEEGD